MRKLSRDDYQRLRDAMANSQHLRGSGRMLDLAFTHIEEADEMRQRLYERLDQLEWSWCFRVRHFFIDWYYRAIAKTFGR